MIIGTTFALVAFCIMLYVPIPVVTLSVTNFLFGFFLSSFLVCFTMIREINAPAIAATAIGFMNAFDAFLGAISDPLTGKFLDMGWSGKLVDGARIYSVSTYKIALTTIPIYLAVALGLLFLIQETYCKSSYPSTMP